MEASVGEVKSKWSAKMCVAKSMYSTYKAAKKMEKNMDKEGEGEEEEKQP